MRVCVFSAHPKLWSDELAAVAQAYAETCVFRHNPERSQQAGQLYAYVGENLAITSNPKKNYTDLINSWFQEREYYDFETNSCLPGQMCGHYTQVCIFPRFPPSMQCTSLLLLSFVDRSFGQVRVTWAVAFTDAKAPLVSITLTR